MSTPVSSPKPLHPITPSFRSSTPVQAPLTRFGSAGKDTTHFGNGGSDNSGSSQDSGWTWQYWVSLPFRLPLAPFYMIKTLFTEGNPFKGWNEAFGIQSDAQTSGTDDTKKPEDSPKGDDSLKKEPKKEDPKKPNPPNDKTALQAALKSPNAPGSAAIVLSALQDPKTQNETMQAILDLRNLNTGHKTTSNRVKTGSDLRNSLLNDQKIAQHIRDFAQKDPSSEIGTKLLSKVDKAATKYKAASDKNYNHLHQIARKEDQENAKAAAKVLVDRAKTREEKVAVFVNLLTATNQNQNQGPDAQATNTSKLMALLVLAEQSADVKTAVMQAQGVNIKALIKETTDPKEQAIANAAIQLFTGKEVLELIQNAADETALKDRLTTLDSAANHKGDADIKKHLQTIIATHDAKHTANVRKLAVKYLDAAGITAALKDANGDAAKAGHILEAINAAPHKAELLKHPELLKELENLANSSNNVAIKTGVAKLAVDIEVANSQLTRHIRPQLQAELTGINGDDAVDKMKRQLDKLDDDAAHHIVSETLATFANPVQSATTSSPILQAFAKSTKVQTFLQEEDVRNNIVKIASYNNIHADDKKALIQLLVNSTVDKAEEQIVKLLKATDAQQMTLDVLKESPDRFKELVNQKSITDQLQALANVAVNGNNQNYKSIKSAALNLILQTENPALINTAIKENNSFPITALMLRFEQDKLRTLVERNDIEATLVAYDNKQAGAFATAVALMASHSDPGKNVLSGTDETKTETALKNLDVIQDPSSRKIIFANKQFRDTLVTTLAPKNNTKYGKVLASVILKNIQYFPESEVKAALESVQGQLSEADIVKQFVAIADGTTVETQRNNVARSTAAAILVANSENQKNQTAWATQINTLLIKVDLPYFVQDAVIGAVISNTAAHDIIKTKTTETDLLRTSILQKAGYSQKATLQSLISPQTTP